MDKTIIFQIIGSLWGIAIGLVFILGAVKKWKVIVDPPEEWWPFYTQALYKKFIGKDSLSAQTYIVGLCCLFVGFYYLIKAIARF